MRSWYRHMDLHEFYNNLDDLVLSILIFIATVYVCNVLRKVQGKLLSMVGLNGFDFRMAAAEMIGTMELGVICFELNFIINDLFGPAVYTIMLFLSLMWQHKRASEFAYYANPSIIFVKHVKSYRAVTLDGHFSSYIFIMFMLVGEMCGAALAYYWVTMVAWKYAYLWTFWKSSNYHMKRYGSSWSSSLRSSPSFGMGIEGGFTFLCYIWPKLIKHKTNFGGDAALLLINAGRALFSGIGQQYTGGYYNPIMATALEYTTGGYSLTTKFQVYWAAPIVSSIVAMFIT